MATEDIAETQVESAAVAPEVRRQLGEMRERLQSTVGQVVLAMMALPRYRSQTLADLSYLVIEPLLNDRLAIATPRAQDGKEPADGALIGIAVWASVSDPTDAKIREQVAGGNFPVRLVAADWNSGETLWLLDVIAPNSALATAVLANFDQIAKGRQVNVHPIVARSVDPAALERMRGGGGSTG
jgi:cytolysin-activating lysine-acyltransferase